MGKINENYIFSGVLKDISVSKHLTEYLYDGRNIRLTAREENTLLSITNERGTLEAKDKTETQIVIEGDYLGHVLLNQYLVIFSRELPKDSNNDYITRVDLSKEPYEKLILYNGNLNFSSPILAICSYETDKIQKVYWTDGVNQPRIINIVDSRIAKRDPESNYPTYYPFSDDFFDFVPKLQLKENIFVKKIVGAGGTFASGVIQYAFTYYRLHGQESNIFYITPLYYISQLTRGGKADEKVDNVFDIQIDKSTLDVDENYNPNFDYLRIYSIQRTSINATPICKRILDICLHDIHFTDGNNTLHYLDTGSSGNYVDPTELLYKGGEPIRAATIELKDNTLFLGNITVTRKPILDAISNYYDKSNHKLFERNKIEDNIVLLETGSRFIVPYEVESSNSYTYLNQLNASEAIFKGTSENYEATIYNKTVPCGGFKRGNNYRLGVLFQYKTGIWSDPVYINTIMNDKFSEEIKDNVNNITGIRIPIFRGTLSYTVCNSLINAGYVKARAVVVYPTINDRNVICQGVTCSTLYTKSQRNNDKNIFALSSWFFRPYHNNNKGLSEENTGLVLKDGTVSPKSDNEGLAYTEISDTYNPLDNNLISDNKLTLNNKTLNNNLNIRQVEVLGFFNDENRFKIDSLVLTFHSPDIEFDSSLYHTEFLNTSYRKIGYVKFVNTLSDIYILTETPTIHTAGAGFVHKSFNKEHSYGIVAGLFYDDYIVDDLDDTKGFRPYDKEHSPYKWMIYPWHRTGSLNNDINRPSDGGTATAILRKKVISNLRYANTIYQYPLNIDELDTINNKFDNYLPVLYSSNEADIVKIKHNVKDDKNEIISSNNYLGNVDTALVPDAAQGLFLGFDGDYWNDDNENTDFATEKIIWKLWGKNENGRENGLYYFTFKPDNLTDNLLDDMKNRFTKIFDEGKMNDITDSKWYKTVGDIGSSFSSLVLSKDSVRMRYKSQPHIVGYFPNILETKVDFTLPIVEIVRTEISNLFGGTSLDALKENLWLPCGEPVRLDTATEEKGMTFEYSWGDTYFQRYDCLKTYPFTSEDKNQIVEIGSFMLETYVNIDGRCDRNRGQQSNINMSPINFNLYNPVYSQLNNFFNYQIKDDEYYDNIVFPNQITWTKEKSSGADVDLYTNITLASVYDMDGNKEEVTSLNTWQNDIYCFLKHGISRILFNTRVQVPTSDGVPIELTNSYKVDGCTYLSDGIGCNSNRLITKTPNGLYFIDSTDNQLFILNKESLASLSERLNMHTVFKDVSKSNTPINNVFYDCINKDVYTVSDATALCYSEKLQQFTGRYDYQGISLLETYNSHVFTLDSENQLWKMFEGDYCKIFDTNYPWEFTFISNGISNNTAINDKIFTNLEFRATVLTDGDYDVITNKFIPIKPIDFVESWNEYQHGYTLLETLQGHNAMIHSSEDTNSLKRKFRIWRCDIPRNNTLLDKDRQTNIIYPYSTDFELNISRHIRKPFDRMRNPWLYIKLRKNAAPEEESLHKTEIHDVAVSYFV